MSPFRSRRGWFPAVLAAAVLVAGTYALQVVSDRVYDGRSRPQGTGASLWDWLGSTYLGLFGPYPRSADTFGEQTALVAFGVVALLVATVFSWRALRALAPGSGALPAWLSMWTAMVLGTVFGNLAHWVVADYDVVTGGAAAAPLLSVLTEGCAFGVKWGWLPALLGTLVWVVVRPRPDRGDLDNDIVFDPDGTGYRGTDAPQAPQHPQAAQTAQTAQTTPGTGPSGDVGADPETRPIPQARRREEPHPDAPYR